MAGKNTSVNLELEPVWQKRYRIARFFVYLIFILGFFCAIYLILFPSANFVFSFKNPDSSKNTVVEPRNEKRELVKNGRVPADNKLIFDTNLIGDFSKVEATFILSEKSSDVAEGKVSVRKSFRSFFYPKGDEINKAETPELFKIGSDYYQLADKTLYKFVSEKAYLSKYSANQAFTEDENFLRNYPVSQEFLGFRDGSLLSSGVSVYVVSGNKIWPINNPKTFQSMGWNWDDVIPVSEEEISVYQKEKLFTLKTPHPDGTLFSDKETGKYYLISGGEKHELVGQGAISFYLKTNPVLVEEKNLEIKGGCVLAKSFSLSEKYKCDIPISEINNFSGNDFEFESSFGKDIDIQDISVNFKKEMTWKNLRSSLITLMNRAITNYGQTP